MERKLTAIFSADVKGYSRLMGDDEEETIHTEFVWDNRRERCFAVYREGETFELHQTGGLEKEVFGRAPGNPEGY